MRKSPRDIGGPLDWRALYAKGLPAKEDQRQAVHRLHRAGLTLAQISLCAQLTLSEVKHILGVTS